MSRYNNKNENENDNTVTVKEFNIPEDKFVAVHEILSSKTSWYNKKDRLLVLTGISPFAEFVVKSVHHFIKLGILTLEQ